MGKSHNLPELDQWIREQLAEYTPQARARHSFAYFGDLPLGETWAGCFGVHRDSDVLERSNWRVIKADLEKRFPDDVRDERSSHWLVGWSDSLTVRLLNDDGTPTDAARAVYQWKEKLADYPVADESDYSELELDDERETWENCYRGDFRRALVKKFGETAEELSDAQLDKLFHGTEPEWEHDSGGCYTKLEHAVEAIEALPQPEQESKPEQG